LNKRKIINDPVHGFITIPNDLVYDVVAHPWFQRLRRIQQMALNWVVYPGAVHTRFQHALGAVHLTMEAIQVLRSKGHHITEEEEKGTTLAILLHDIGHGPFSHTLERTIVDNVNHEQISLLIMESLNRQFGGRLSVAIDIFTDKYPKRFLHQLVSSQLDMDRLDYLSRDSFYTGVQEGVIGSERIIRMLEVNNDRLVVEEKGIYSIEKFIVSRRLMYWQVYLHKTSLCADHMLINALGRARYLVREKGMKLACSKPLWHFLSREVSFDDFTNDNTHLDMFTRLDDVDVMSALKAWAYSDDKILQYLCSGILDRKLLKLKFVAKSHADAILQQQEAKLLASGRWQREDMSFLLIKDNVSNTAYQLEKDHILIQMKNGEVRDIAALEEQEGLRALAHAVQKWYVCYPEIEEI
jgi:uncharacterized protein